MGHLTAMLAFTLFTIIHAVYQFSEIITSLSEHKAEIQYENGENETMGYLFITKKFKSELIVTMILLIGTLAWIIFYLLTQLGKVM